MKTNQLLNAMNDLKNTQNESLCLVLPMTIKETTQYAELYISKIWRCRRSTHQNYCVSRSKNSGVGKNFAVPVSMAIIFALLLTIFLPTSCLHFGAKEKHPLNSITRILIWYSLNQRSRSFLIYNLENEGLGYVSHNCQRVLGIKVQWSMTEAECVDQVLSAHKVGKEYDVCLIVWKMPDMDGIEVTQTIIWFKQLYTSY